MTLNNEIDRRLQILGLPPFGALPEVSSNFGIVQPKQDVVDYIAYLEEQYQCKIYHIVEGPAILGDRYFMLAISNDKKEWDNELTPEHDNRFLVYAFFGSLRQYHYEPGYVTVEKHGDHLIYVANPNLLKIFSSIQCPGKKVNL